MAFRSVRMRVFNMTSVPLTKTRDHLVVGEFTNPFQPPQTISPGQLAEWRAESAGVLQGTEGNVFYEVIGQGDRIQFEWTNPAVGNTFFKFSPPTRPDGSPSDFVFFATHIALDESAEPDPALGAPVVAVSQGDIDADGVILPLPGQAGIKPHAWFGVGLRNRREPISIRSWLRALNIDPSQGLRTFLIPHFSVRKLIELAF
ncbi:MAG: hypothetical protein M3178_09990 [Pseudomonadota bacterium]|nr:hypothetical protein [Pseudomonadota bacterium]